MTWNLVRSLTDDQLNDLHDMFRHEWWTKGRTRADVAHMVDHSDVIYGIVDPDTHTLAAFARALTDYTYKAMIFDVIVSLNYRDRGLGNRLMTEIIESDELSDVKHLELYCVDDMIEFYAQWDFADDDLTDLTLLRRPHTEPTHGQQ